MGSSETYGYRWAPSVQQTTNLLHRSSQIYFASDRLARIPRSISNVRFAISNSKDKRIGVEQKVSLCLRLPVMRKEMTK